MIFKLLFYMGTDLFIRARLAVPSNEHSSRVESLMSALTFLTSDGTCYTSEIEPTPSTFRVYHWKIPNEFARFLWLKFRTDISVDVTRLESWIYTAEVFEDDQVRIMEGDK